MNKYAWSTTDDAEIWSNVIYDTVEECLEDAYGCCDEEQEHVFVGNAIPFSPSVDAESVLDRVQEQAYEECGEVGGDWCAYDYKKQDELNELSEKLTEVLNGWLNKYGYSPNFYYIENIQLYELKERESDGRQKNGDAGEIWRRYYR